MLYEYYFILQFYLFSRLKESKFSN